MVEEEDSHTSYALNLNSSHFKDLAKEPSKMVVEVDMALNVDDEGVVAASSLVDNKVGKVADKPDVRALLDKDEVGRKDEAVAIMRSL